MKNKTVKENRKNKFERSSQKFEAKPKPKKKRKMKRKNKEIKWKIRKN